MWFSGFRVLEGLRGLIGFGSCFYSRVSQNALQALSKAMATLATSPAFNNGIKETNNNRFRFGCRVEGFGFWG